MLPLREKLLDTLPYRRREQIISLPVWLLTHQDVSQIESDVDNLESDVDDLDSEPHDTESDSFSEEI